MVTSKSTVLGLRLDHDRRAWVEAEAARRGVTVRVLFEGLIDGAQAGRSAGTDEGAADVPNRPRPLPSTGPPPRPDAGSLAALPGRLIRGAISLPVNILKTSGRCAHKSLEGYSALRSWSGRSG